MRKLLVAAAVAAVATLGFAGHASAQAFYPKTPTNVPARVGGAYGYPSQQYPTYPGDYSTPSHKRHDRDEKARRDRDRDDDDRRWQNSDRERSDRGANYGYGTNAGAYSVPSRVGGYDTPSRSHSTNGATHDSRWDRDGR
jgi:hypothetical protein